MAYVLERKLYGELLQWKRTSAGREALLIEGAPGVGKTTLTREFGRNEYRSYLHLDFSESDPELAACFGDSALDLEALFAEWTRLTGVELHERDTLVILDEINRLPQILPCLTRMVSDGRYDYIATCSFNPIQDGWRVHRLPEKVQPVFLEPLDFEEFLWARGEEELARRIAKCFLAGKGLKQKQHERASRLQREHMFIGGMPQAVAAFASHGSASDAEIEKRDVLEQYLYFIAEFINCDSKSLASMLNPSPWKTSTGHRPFYYCIGNHIHPLEYAPIFDWLEASYLVNRCIRRKGLSSIDEKEHREDIFRYYLSDTGLLTTLSLRDDVDSVDSFYGVEKGLKLWIDCGKLVENYVAQCLHRVSHALQYLIANEDPKSACYEVDFILDAPGTELDRSRLTLIEAKSGKRYRTKSLDHFERRLEASGRLSASIVLGPKSYRVLSQQKGSKEGSARIRRVQVPLYMAGLIQPFA